MQTVVRRRFDPDDKTAEVRFPEDAAGAAQALEQYDALSKLIDSSAPGARYAALSDHMDIDAYLRWDAFHTYVQNGDYVDETFFAASSEDHGSGQRLYYRNIAWDSDDLFKACHHSGQFAYPDPHGLLYCAEGNLDRALLDDPDLYARFLYALEALMKIWTPARVEQELAVVKKQLFAVLDDEHVCATSKEGAAEAPEAGTCDALRAEISESIDGFVTLLDDRASLLRTGIAAARKTP